MVHQSQTVYLSIWLLEMDYMLYAEDHLESFNVIRDADRHFRKERVLKNRKDSFLHCDDEGLLALLAKSQQS